MCRNVQRLTTNPPCLSTPDRRKPILAGGDGRHGPPEGHALQRPAAPHSPQQPQISLSTAGLPGKENPGKCYRKSPENQTKLSPRRISQRPRQSCRLPKPTVLQPLAGRLAYTLFLRFLSPSFLCEEQESRKGSVPAKPHFFNSFSLPLPHQVFTACVNPSVRFVALWEPCGTTGEAPPGHLPTTGHGDALCKWLIKAQPEPWVLFSWVPSDSAHTRRAGAGRVVFKVEGPQAQAWSRETEVKLLTSCPL